MRQNWCTTPMKDRTLVAQLLVSPVKYQTRSEISNMQPTPSKGITQRVETHGFHPYLILTHIQLYIQLHSPFWGILLSTLPRWLAALTDLGAFFSPIAPVLLTIWSVYDRCNILGLDLPDGFGGNMSFSRLCRGFKCKCLTVSDCRRLCIYNAVDI